MIAVEPAPSPSFAAPPEDPPGRPNPPPRSSSRQPAFPTSGSSSGCPTPVAAGRGPGEAHGLALWRRAVARGWWILVTILLLGGGLVAPAWAQGTPRDGLTWVVPDGVDPGVVVDGPALALATEVELAVHGPVVRGTVTQRYVNPHEVWVAGVYRFPLPTAAAVDGLTMVVGDRVLEGQIHEKEEARRVYEQAERQGVKATLVEEKRPNLFTTRVANVGPGERVEVTVTFQWLAEWRNGVFSLRMPMTFTPRFHPGPALPPLPTVVASSPDQLPAPTPEAGQPAELTELADRATRFAEDSVHLVEQEAAKVVTAARRAMSSVHPALGTPAADTGPPPPLQPLELTVDLAAGTRLGRLASPSHRLAVTAREPERGRYSLTLEPGAVAPDREFELTWQPELAESPRPVLFHEEVGGDVYALLMVLPPAPETSAFTRLPRETVFILDVSGSMQGAGIRQAKTALLLALERLQPEDSFNVLAFNHQTRALFPGSWPARPEVVAKARAWVRGLGATGGTEMLPALLSAFDGRSDGYGTAGERAVKQVIFITDGAVANEAELFTVIEDYLGETRLFTVGIGSAPNGHFMEEAARLGRGTATFIARPEQVAERMGGLFEKLESPTLTGVQLRWDDPGAEVFPERLPDLYAGEPVVVSARLLELGEEVVLSGERDGLLWDETVSVARSATTARGVGKLWARHKIDHLMSGYRRAPRWDPEGNLSPERSALRQRVVDVALAHHLVSPFTSLVAVDVTPTRPETEGLESGAVPNVRPAGAAWSRPGFLPATATSGPRALALGLGLLLLGVVLRRVLLPRTLPGGPLGGRRGFPRGSR